jgi:hypothetical protein
MNIELEKDKAKTEEDLVTKQQGFRVFLLAYFLFSSALLSNFMCTKTEPKLYYLPKSEEEATNRLNTFQKDKKPQDKEEKNEEKDEEKDEKKENEKKENELTVE